MDTYSFVRATFPCLKYIWLCVAKMAGRSSIGLLLNVTALSIISILSKLLYIPFSVQNKVQSFKAIVVLFIFLSWKSSEKSHKQPSVHLVLAIIHIILRPLSVRHRARLLIPQGLGTDYLTAWIFSFMADNDP